jgi:hypothetical protein
VAAVKHRFMEPDREGSNCRELFPIRSILFRMICAPVNAALDGRNSSLSPNLREYYLTMHIARAISMSDIACCSIRNSGLEHDETKFL